MEYKVYITVISQRGRCAAGHKVGDVIEVTGPLITKGSICNSALVAIFPEILALRLGAEIPWAKEGKVKVACPDAENPVIFEIYRGERID